MPATFEEYLEARQIIAKERSCLFDALRLYLQPGQRPDAQVLREPRWDHPARTIQDHEWVANARRGYLVLGQTTARPFQLMVEQLGHELRWCVTRDFEANIHGPLLLQRLTAGLGHTEFKNGTGRLITAPEDVPPSLLFEYQKNVPQLYTDERVFEHALHLTWILFNAAVLHLIPSQK